MKKEVQNTENDIRLINCLTGDASVEEQKQAFDWINESEENQQYYRQIRDAWIALSLDHPTDNKRMEEVWRKIQKRSSLKIPDMKMVKKSNTYRFSQILNYAALALLLMGLGALLFYMVGSGKPVTKLMTYAVEAPLGAKAKVTLPDGTLVNLNAGSKLTYTSEYNERERNVLLSGEAFFKVAKDKSKPFTVIASGLKVKALGTSFNVKAYPQDDIIETTLVEGSVKIESKNRANEPKVLMPKEKLTFHKAKNEMEIAQLRSETEKPVVEKKTEAREEQKLKTLESITSWKENRLIFDNENLNEMVVKMQRWYGVQIQLKASDLTNAHFSGKFIYNETIYQVLDILSRTTPIHYQTKDHVIYIYSD